MKKLNPLCIFECPLFETILFTTDGIHDYMAHDILERIMSRSLEYEQKLNEIIQAAKEEDSHDDLTAVLLYVNVKR